MALWRHWKCWKKIFIRDKIESTFVWGLKHNADTPWTPSQTEKSLINFFRLLIFWQREKIVDSHQLFDWLSNNDDDIQFSRMSYVCLTPFWHTMKIWNRYAKQLDQFLNLSHLTLTFFNQINSSKFPSLAFHHTFFSLSLSPSFSSGRYLRGRRVFFFIYQLSPLFLLSFHCCLANKENNSLVFFFVTEFF